ncbi:hypothetical protein [Paenibacillus illinoisensis]|uniref:hypothetical protein n=1 Tax=Paenibacillus illinoisensis TaxID=59845 RepID=UPI00301E08E7
MSSKHTILLGGEIRTDIAFKQKAGERFASFRLKCGKAENVTAVAKGTLAASISDDYSNGSKIYARGKLAKIDLGHLTQRTEHVVFLIEELLPVEEMDKEFINQFEIEGTILNVSRNTKGSVLTLKLPIQGNADFSISAQCHGTNPRTIIGSKHIFKGSLGNTYENHPQLKNKILRQSFFLFVRGIYQQRNDK